MGAHVVFTATCIGDAVTSISETLKVAKSSNEIIDLLVNGVNVRVRPTSDAIDLVEIYNLKLKTKK